MSQAPTPMGTARGYESPSVTQFSIFMPNRVGKMLELVKAFEDHMCRICSLGVHDASDHAVIRLVTSNSAECRKVLHEQELTFLETEILIVCIDESHTLTKMCHFLLGAELNIRFAYAMMGWAAGPTAIALAVDDITLASQILVRKEFRLLGEGDLPKYGE